MSLRHRVLKVELAIEQKLVRLTSNILYCPGGEEEHLIATNVETVVTVKEDVWEVFQQGVDRLMGDLMASIGLSAEGSKRETPLAEDDDDEVSLDDDPEL